MIYLLPLYRWCAKVQTIQYENNFSFQFHTKAPIFACCILIFLLISETSVSVLPHFSLKQPTFLKGTFKVIMEAANALSHWTNASCQAVILTV